MGFRGFIILISILAGASARAEDCRTAFLASLQAKDPAGYGVWNSLADDGKKQLEDLIVCAPDLTVDSDDIGTLVHESIHLADNERSNTTGKAEYLTVSGSFAAFNPDSRDYEYAFARGQAITAMPARERIFSRASNYLFELGDSPFELLLDELNAYTHGLRTLLRFPPRTKNIVNSGDGPLEMIVFTLRYLEAMEKRQPSFYKGRIFGDTATVETMRTLIQEGYAATAEACSRSDLHLDDRALIHSLGTPGSVRQLTAIFGKTIPSLPAICAKNAVSILKKPAPVTPAFPKKETVHRTNGEHDSKTGKTVDESTTTNRLDPPKFEGYDPAKPSADYTVHRIDNLHLTLTADVEHVHVVLYFGPTPAENYTEFDGKRLDEAEMNRFVADRQDVVVRMNNGHVVKTD